MKLFELHTINKVKFLAVPKYNGVFIADEEGNFYGSYMTFENFKGYFDKKDAPIYKTVVIDFRSISI